MRSTVNRAIVFALYQLTLFAGLLMLPMALAMEKVGITLPVHRAVSRFGEAYEEIGGQDA